MKPFDLDAAWYQIFTYGQQQWDNKSRKLSARGVRKIAIVE